jgi:outer membrane protein
MKNSLKRALPAAIALALGLSAMPAAAYEAGDWVVRGRIINVNPNDDSGAASLNGMPIVGSGVGVNDDTTLELDFTYMLDPHWGMELILATTKHEASGKGVLAPAGTILDTWVLPPTLTLQYHFSPSSNIRPYAGVGLNYTHFYDEDAKNAPSSVKAELDDSWGLAAQAGVDVDINKDWFVNFDVKYIDIDTTAKLSDGIDTIKVDVDIDPLVWGIGIGRTF